LNEKQEKIAHKFNNVMFQKLEQYDIAETDTRFIKAKVWICHTGSNYNASYFSEESISNAMESLSNTPILCFYTVNKEGDEDFGGHEYQIEKTNNGLELICKEYAIGVISESDQKTARFEERLCDDGIVRMFLTCTCTLWTKFNQAMNIFEKQNVKGQSMEITDIEGDFEDDNLYHINKFHFNGCTVLSNECMPAMANASIEVNFSKQNNKSIAEEIENKLNEFAKYFSKKEEEQINMENTVTQEIENKETEVKENFSTEQVEQIESKQEDFACDEKKNMSEEDTKDGEDCPKCGHNPCTCEEDFAKSDEKKDEESKTEDKIADEELEEKMACGDKEKKYSLTFSLSHEDIANQLYNKLWDMSSIENTCYYIMKTMDSYFVYVDCMTGQLYEQTYAKSDDSITFTGERKEVFNIVVDKETKDAMTATTYSKLQKDLEDAQIKVQEYSKANEELLKFQLDVNENKRKADIDKVISSFSKINELDLENYKQKAYKKELSKEQLEDKLYAELGKMNFSKLTGEKIEEEIEAPTNYSVNLEEQDKCPYAGCEDLFK